MFLLVIPTQMCRAYSDRSMNTKNTKGRTVRTKRLFVVLFGVFGSSEVEVGEEFLNGVDQFNLSVLDGEELCFEVVDCVYLFIGLVEIPSWFEPAAVHECEVGLVWRFDGDECEVVLIVVLDGLRDVVGVRVEGRQFFEVPDDFVEFSVGGGFDDVLLYLLLFLCHSYKSQSNIYSAAAFILFDILNARERLEPQEQQGAPRNHRTHPRPEEAPHQPPRCQEPPRQPQHRQTQACLLRPPQPPPEAHHRAEQPQYGAAHHEDHAGEAQPEPLQQLAQRGGAQPQGLLLPQPQHQDEADPAGELQDVHPTHHHFPHHQQGPLEEAEPADLQVQVEPPPRQIPQARLLPRGLQDAQQAAQVQVHQHGGQRQKAPQPQEIQSTMSINPPSFLFVIYDSQNYHFLYSSADPWNPNPSTWQCSRQTYSRNSWWPGKGRLLQSTPSLRRSSSKWRGS